MTVFNKTWKHKAVTVSQVARLRSHTHIMNISLGNETLEYYSIQTLSKCKAGVKVEMSVFVSSFIILITTVSIVR